MSHAYPFVRSELQRLDAHDLAAMLVRYSEGEEFTTFQFQKLERLLLDRYHAVRAEQRERERLAWVAERKAQVAR